MELEATPLLYSVSSGEIDETYLIKNISSFKWIICYRDNILGKDLSWKEESFNNKNDPNYYFTEYSKAFDLLTVYIHHKQILDNKIKELETHVIQPLYNPIYINTEEDWNNVLTPADIESLLYSKGFSNLNIHKSNSIKMGVQFTTSFIEEMLQLENTLINISKYYKVINYFNFDMKPAFNTPPLCYYWGNYTRHFTLIKLY